VRSLPTLNAFLNATSAALLLLAYRAIKARPRRVEEHRRFVLAAVASSTLFLISYLVYHFQVGSVRFQGPPGVRRVYLAILLTHTLLAAVLPFLAARTLYLGWNRRDAEHRRIARWTFPIWMYVSVTGVVIYVMLYLLYPRGAAVAVLAL
jgi:uncharacterized membrane protein YozB (DUF420 family)